MVGNLVTLTRSSADRPALLSSGVVRTDPALTSICSVLEAGRSTTEFRLVPGNWPAEATPVARAKATKLVVMSFIFIFHFNWRGIASVRGQDKTAGCISVAADSGHDCCAYRNALGPFRGAGEQELTDQITHQRLVTGVTSNENSPTSLASGSGSASQFPPQWLSTQNDGITCLDASGYHGRDRIIEGAGVLHHRPGARAAQERAAKQPRINPHPWLRSKLR